MNLFPSIARIRGGYNLFCFWLRCLLLSHQANRFLSYLVCSGQRGPSNESGWSFCETTHGEKAALQYVLEKIDRRGTRILHVGIGNGELGAVLARPNVEIVGLTINQGEKTNSGNAYRAVHVANKYSLPLSAPGLRGPFDIVIDVNLFSYACCWLDALRYFWYLASTLSDDGCIITHLSGMEYAPTNIFLTEGLLSRVCSAEGLTMHVPEYGLVIMSKIDPSHRA